MPNRLLYHLATRTKVIETVEIRKEFNHTTKKSIVGRSLNATTPFGSFGVTEVVRPRGTGGSVTWMRAQLRATLPTLARPYSTTARSAHFLLPSLFYGELWRVVSTRG